jgi:hypothetical protein
VYQVLTGSSYAFDLHSIGIENSTCLSAGALINVKPREEDDPRSKSKLYFIGGFELFGWKLEAIVTLSDFDAARTVNCIRLLRKGLSFESDALCFFQGLPSIRPRLVWILTTCNAPRWEN